MPKYILDNYSLAKEIGVTVRENDVTINVKDSMFKTLFTQEKTNKSVLLLGCPIISSVVCAIVKSSGKPVKIQEVRFSDEGSYITATAQMIQDDKK